MSCIDCKHYRNDTETCRLNDCPFTQQDDTPPAVAGKVLTEWYIDKEKTELGKTKYFVANARGRTLPFGNQRYFSNRKWLVGIISSAGYVVYRGRLWK